MQWLLLSVQSLSRVWLFAAPWTAACQASLSITNSQSLLKLIPLNPWCHPTISSSVIPFSYPLQSCPGSGSFPMCQFFPSSGQSIGASTSASVLPMTIQGQFSLGLTCLILLSKGSQEFSSAQHFRSINYLVLSFLMVRFSHPYTTTGKIITLTIWIFVGKVMSRLCFLICYLGWS